MSKTSQIIVKGINITTLKLGADFFISLTDIARNKNSEEPKDVVKTGCTQVMLLSYGKFMK
jgi:hypothetical protein